VRILALSPRIPWPLDHGGNQRSFHLLAGLAARHELHLVAGDDGSAGDQAMAALAARSIRAEVAPLRPRFGRIGTAARLAKIPYILAGESTLIPRFRSRPLAALVRSALAEAPDLVVLDHVWMRAFRRELAGTPYVLSTHNVESAIQAQKGARRPFRLEALLARKEAAALARAEAEAAATAVLTVAVSDADAGLLLRLAPGARVLVVENGVETASLLETPEPPSAPLRLYFIGSTDYEPNRRAARRLADQVFPRVRACRPDAELWIAGRDPAGALSDLAGRPGLRLLGRVADLRAFLAEVRILVAPLDYGGGSRIKILEAWASGRACVTTPAGAAGLGEPSSLPLAIADNDADLAAQVLDLAASGAREADLVRRGRERVRERHDWAFLAGRFAKAVEEAWAARARLARLRDRR
jgi:glycosyltransferase involved in cell wall biosynthesis